MNKEQVLLKQACAILNRRVLDQPAAFQLVTPNDIGFYILDKDELDAAVGEKIVSSMYPLSVSMSTMKLKAHHFYWSRGLRIRFLVEHCEGTGCKSVQNALGIGQFVVIDFNVKSLSYRITQIRNYTANILGCFWDEFIKDQKGTLLSIAENPEATEDKADADGADEVSSIISNVSQELADKVVHVWDDPRHRHYGLW